MDNITLGAQPKEIEVPVTHETFEAQILIKTKPYKKMEYPFAPSMSYPMEQTQRVLDSGKFKVELVLSSIANGKPTLLIEEV